jgi:SAM-dependent methyltransferase
MNNIGSRLLQKAWNVSRGVLQSYGPPVLKRRLWNKEFDGGRWSCLVSTEGDCVYTWIEKYAKKGRILDLGCGSGNTANELDGSSYEEYLGLDISDVATRMAAKRSEDCGRGSKNRFVCADMESFTPDTDFDVILLRESIYYVPQRKVVSMLHRYSKFLKRDGVFVVRFWYEAKPLLAMIKENFQIVESYFSADSPTASPNYEAVLIFRPKA